MRLLFADGRALGVRDEEIQSLPFFECYLAGWTKGTTVEVVEFPPDISLEFVQDLLELTQGKISRTEVLIRSAKRATDLTRQHLNYFLPSPESPPDLVMGYLPSDEHLALLAPYQVIVQKDIYDSVDYSYDKAYNHVEVAYTQKVIALQGLSPKTTERVALQYLTLNLEGFHLTYQYANAEVQQKIAQAILPQEEETVQRYWRYLQTHQLSLPPISYLPIKKMGKTGRQMIFYQQMLHPTWKKNWFELLEYGHNYARDLDFTEYLLQLWQDPVEEMNQTVEYLLRYISIFSPENYERLWTRLAQQTDLSIYGRFLLDQARLFGEAKTPEEKRRVKVAVWWLVPKFTSDSFSILCSKAYSYVDVDQLPALNPEYLSHLTLPSFLALKARYNFYLHRERITNPMLSAIIRSKDSPKSLQPLSPPVPRLWLHPTCQFIILDYQEVIAIQKGEFLYSLTSEERTAAEFLGYSVSYFPEVEGCDVTKAYYLGKLRIYQIYGRAIVMNQVRVTDLPTILQHKLCFPRPK